MARTLEIGNTGDVVGNYADANNNSFGFVYSGGQYTMIGAPGTTVTGINSAGTVVGYYETGEGIQSFTEQGGVYTNNIVDSDAPQSTFALGINASGEIVGVAYINTNDTEGFIYKDGSSTPINDPNANESVSESGNSSGTFAFAINASGQVLGDYFDSSGNSHGFIYNTNGSFTGISVEGAASTYAEGINNAGQAVGYYVDASNEVHGFLYSGGSIATLNDPAAAGGTVAFAINNTGEVVGYYWDGNGNEDVFTYSNGIYSNIAVPNANDSIEGLSVNDAGQIVVTYYNDNGLDGILLNPTTAPATLILSGGTTVTDSTIVVGGVDTLEVPAGSGSPGATLSDVTLDNSGTVNVQGVLDLDGGTVANSGTLEATNGGTVDFNDGYTNYGTIETANNGVINIDATDGNNINFGTIEALDGTINVYLTGYGANYNLMEAGAGGTINVDRIDWTPSQISTNGTYEAIGGGAIVFSNTGGNSGIVEASGEGSSITFNVQQSTESTSATIEAVSDGTVTFNGGTIVNSGGAIKALSGGAVDINHSTVINAGGTISASGDSSEVELTDATINGGTLTTGAGGAIEFVGTNNVLNGGGTASNSSISVPVHESSTVWNDSGIHVTAGEQITITASGTITIGSGVVIGGQNVDSETPAGDPNLITGDIASNPDDFLENGLIPWSLIGIISGLSPAANAADAFQVDNGTTFTAAATGELYLSINDNVFTDNSGNWSATVSLSSPDTVTNSGFTQLESGATLTLEGVIDNTGTIDVDTVINNPNTTNLVISGGVVLEGSGSVTLDGSTDSIIGATGGGILDNAGNTISGSGNIGLNGNGLLSLVNYGTVEATTGNLVIDTGHTVVNNGTLEANGATLVVDDAVSGSGQIVVTNGGTADFAAALGENVTFSGAGTLGLADPTAFNGEITGLSLGDTIDLTGISPSSIESARISGSSLVIDFSGDETPLSFNLGSAPTGLAIAAQSDGSSGTDLVAYNSFNAGTVNYTNFSSEFSYPGSNYSGPQITQNGTALQLTDGGQGEYGSWFGSTQQSVTNFTASFEYEATASGTAADGMAFVLQTEASNALGGPFYEYGGSGLGYAGISSSIAIEFNIFSGHTQGTNLGIDGSTGVYNPTGAVALQNGDPIEVNLSYNGSILTETLTDLSNHATYSTNYTISAADLTNILGSGSAYVGFTGGSGLDTATQTVSNFVFDPNTATSSFSDIIANNASLEFATAAGSGTTASFAGANGDLILDQPSSFQGAIAGISGTGDVLDLKGFDASATAMTGANSFELDNGQHDFDGGRGRPYDRAVDVGRQLFGFYL